MGHLERGDRASLPGEATQDNKNRKGVGHERHCKCGLHRRLVDVIKDEFDRRGRVEINPVQALLLYNIGDREATSSKLFV
jgi:hypothetical protein